MGPPGGAGPFFVCRSRGGGWVSQSDVGWFGVGLVGRSSNVLLYIMCIIGVSGMPVGKGLWRLGPAHRPLDRRTRTPLKSSRPTKHVRVGRAQWLARTCHCVPNSISGASHSAIGHTWRPRSRWDRDGIHRRRPEFAGLWPPRPCPSAHGEPVQPRTWRFGGGGLSPFEGVGLGWMFSGGHSRQVVSPCLMHKRCYA